MQPPKTSITLLNAIANDTDTVRWTEFFVKYEPALRGYLVSCFPSLDHDDIIQETLKTLVRRLPDYRYTPDEKGHFCAYLIGIAKHKALDQLHKEKRIKDLQRRSDENKKLMDGNGAHDDEWKMRAMEAAIEQLFADASINPRNKEIFRHVALMHEPPETVASLFGVTRGNVDVIKKRMIEKLSALVAAMTSED
jgi:RNA polymerase sigma factor (sigma-70 family)